VLLRRMIVPAIAVAGAAVLMLTAGLAPAAASGAGHDAPAAARPGANLSGVSCKGNSFCMATGTHRVQGDPSVRLVEAWNGRTWRDVSDPLSGDLTGITCGGPAFCFANRPHTLADWNGATWRTLKGAGPMDVTCGSPKVCMSVAGTDIDQWNGKRWRVNPSTNACDGPPGTPCGYSDLSCGGWSSCLGIDYACIDTECTEGVVYLSEAWDGGGWSDVGGPPTDGGQLSCSWGTFCMLTFGSASASIWQSAGWQDASPDLPAICHGAQNCNLRGPLSCGAPQACVVVPTGSPVSLVWANFSWKAVPLALVGGTLPRLQDLSCGSPSNCMAVGSYGKPWVPVAEHWNGTKWQITKPRAA
jgi:hypothetical protein